MLNFTHFCLLACIAASRADSWYSATIIERRDGIENNTHPQPPYKTNFLLNTDQYLPIQNYPIYNDFTPISGNVDAPQDNSSKSHRKDLTIQYNNTVNNVNVWKRVRPNKKHVRRRCPSKPRRGKNARKPSKLRFLELFQVVEFDHVLCMSGNGLEGTCLPESECTESGGSLMGSCADGYGTCCVTQLQCEDRSDAQTGWFTNPDFPSPSTERLTCTLTLDKSSEDVTQIRLDLVSFEILPPIAGVCQDDQFIISGQNINNVIPILCGINSGQHMFIEVGDVDGPIALTFQTASSDNRLFSIKVSQLTGSEDIAAPPGCLQYFTESQGYLESFNHRDKSEIGIARSPSYLNNLNYAMCLAREPNSCSVTYTNTGEMQILNYDTDGLPIIPPGQAGVEILNCPSDWLLMAATRLCGERLNDGSVYQDFTLNSPITDTNAGPLVIWFRSDESYVGTGFRIFYQQNTCST